MGTVASWNEIATLASATVPIVGISLVSLYLCYKSGTLHPLRNRLTRLFIGREDIEPGPIRNSLSDRSAVVSFAMIYGIHLDTASEVKALIAKAESRDIPLHLIGIAGSAFDRSEFAVKPGRSPRRGVDGMICMGLLVSYLATACFLAGTFADDILIRVRATNTVLWVAAKEGEGAARGILRGRNMAFSQAECEKPPNTGAIEPFVGNEPRYNLSVLCAIWTSPSERKELIDALPQQRTAFGAVALLCLMALVGFLQALTRRNAIRKLERRAPAHSSPVSATPRSGQSRRLVLRIGKSIYLSYGTTEANFYHRPKH
ncbi:DUF6216 family protein [Stenotrophomonas indicatrix]|uniref:DUF6216 family protein n=1 Tax=Stenotrophomonas indicatrix TaxID=2045451 RepID=UPI0028E97633|nr:DUF6216 family protein [Stenotrophomonas indicatrix]MDT9581914.1 DUF6216 family protein [Stenotrophomonas indicatrix]